MLSLSHLRLSHSHSKKLERLEAIKLSSTAIHLKTKDVCFPTTSPYFLAHWRMNKTRSSDIKGHQSGSTQLDESTLDLERNFCGFPNLPSSSPPLQGFTSGGQHSKNNAAYFSWPTSSRLNGAAEDQANYFGNLQKGVLP